MENNTNQFLLNLFHDPKFGYINFNSFFKKVREINKHIEYKTVKSFYDKQKENQIFKTNEVREYNMTKIFWGPGGDLKSDVMDIHRFKDYNDQFKFILVIVDVYSRYAWAFSIYEKSSSHVVPKFEQVYNEIKNAQNTTYAIATDNGGEFVNYKMEKLNEKWNIFHFTDVNKEHILPGLTAIAERFIRTLRNYFKKISSAKQSFSFNKYLNDILYNYNHTYHESIKATPYDVFHKKILPIHPILKEIDILNNGDHVRVMMKKSIVEKKSFTNNYSDEVYQVIQKIHNKYQIKNIRKNTIDRVLRFRHELLKIDKETDNTSTKDFRQMKKHVYTPGLVTSDVDLDYKPPIIVDKSLEKTADLNLTRKTRSNTQELKLPQIKPPKDSPIIKPKKQKNISENDLQFIQTKKEYIQNSINNSTSVKNRQYKDYKGFITFLKEHEGNKTTLDILKISKRKLDDYLSSYKKI